jgi:hypothetical protein
MHIKGTAKAAQNQIDIVARGNTAPSFHRKSTGLSTDGMIHATHARDTRALMHFCATARHDKRVRRRLAVPLRRCRALRGSRRSAIALRRS